MKKMRNGSIINITGPTASGKTTFLLEVLRHRHRLFQKPFNTVLLSLPVEREGEEAHREMAEKVREICSGIHVEVVEGVPDYGILKCYKNSLLIIG